MQDTQATDRKLKRRQARPAAPMSLTGCWGRSHEQDATRERLRTLYHFLAKQGLLTRGGVREYEQDAQAGPPSLSSHHVRSCAGAFLDRVARSPQGLERNWAEYRAGYDLNKKVRPNPFQKVLLSYSSDRTVHGLLRRLWSFPHLLAQLERAAPHAPEDDRRIVLTLLDSLGVEDLLERASTVTDPAAFLEALPHLCCPRGGRDHLAAAVTTAERLGEALSVVALARAVNLPGRWRRVARAQVTRPGLAALARKMESLLDTEHLIAGLAALRTVGDRRSLVCLERMEQGSGMIRIGGRPGLCLIDALRMEAKSCIAEHVREETGTATLQEAGGPGHKSCSNKIQPTGLGA